MNFIKKYKIEFIIFGIALILRIVLFSINFHYQQGNLIDTIHGDDGYYEISQGLVNGHGFTGATVEPFTPNSLRPPVWPLVIAFLVWTFKSYWAVAIFQILISSLIPILGIYVARYILPDRYAMYVGFLLAIEPYSILLSFILYTETCFTFLFLIFIIFLFKYIKEQTVQNAVWIGMFLGLATLVKPTIQYFPVVIPLLFLYIWRKKLTIHLLRHLVIFLVVFSLLISSWIYRNYKEFGVIGMSAQPAFNLYVYLVPTVLSIDNHTSFSTEVSNFVTKDNFDANIINLSNSKLYSEKALKVLKEHKIALLKSLGITLFTFFTHDGMLTILQYSGITFENIISKPIFFFIIHPVKLLGIISHYIFSPALIIIIIRLIWMIITFLFILGLVMNIKKEILKTYTFFVLIIVLYFAFTTAINGLGVNARFRVPINVFIFSFAVYGFYVIKERISKWRSIHETINNHPVL